MSVPLCVVDPVFVFISVELCQKYHLQIFQLFLSWIVYTSLYQLMSASVIFFFSYFSLYFLSSSSLTHICINTHIHTSFLLRVFPSPMFPWNTVCMLLLLCFVLAFSLLVVSISLVVLAYWSEISWGVGSFAPSTSLCSD